MMICAVLRYCNMCWSHKASNLAFISRLVHTFPIGYDSAPSANPTARGDASGSADTEMAPVESGSYYRGTAIGQEY